jgi:hypothetical protein
MESPGPGCWMDQLRSASMNVATNLEILSWCLANESRVGLFCTIIVRHRLRHRIEKQLAGLADLCGRVLPTRDIDAGRREGRRTTPYSSPCSSAGSTGWKPVPRATCAETFRNSCQTAKHVRKKNADSSLVSADSSLCGWKWIAEAADISESAPDRADCRYGRKCRLRSCSAATRPVWSSQDLHRSPFHRLTSPSV